MSKYANAGSLFKPESIDLTPLENAVAAQTAAVEAQGAQIASITDTVVANAQAVQLVATEVTTLASNVGEVKDAVDTVQNSFDEFIDGILGA